MYLAQDPPSPEPIRLMMAPTWRRALAFLPELGVSVLIALFVASIRRWVDWSQFPPDRRWNVFDQLVDVLNTQGPGLLRVAITALATIATLGFLMDALFGGSPFKIGGGLAIVNLRGERPGLARLLLRHLVRAVGLAALGLGPAWSAFDRHRRSLHDRLSGTCVVTAGEQLSTSRQSVSPN